MRRREQTPDPAPAAQSEAATGEPAASAAQQAAAQQTGPASAKPLAFDPASLPPIESIAADTDISAFLQPGVPSDVRNAALRRAWSVDPAISNFKGLQENDWDFNDPNGIPGFGPLESHSRREEDGVGFIRPRKERGAGTGRAGSGHRTGGSLRRYCGRRIAHRSCSGNSPTPRSDHDRVCAARHRYCTQHTESEGEVKPTSPKRRRVAGLLMAI